MRREIMNVAGLRKGKRETDEKQQPQDKGSQPPGKNAPKPRQPQDWLRFADLASSIVDTPEEAMGEDDSVNNSDRQQARRHRRGNSSSRRNSKSKEHRRR